MQRVNKTDGRDQWGKGWSAFVSGGLIQGGRERGSTNADGTDIKDGLTYSSEDLMTTICHALGIDINKSYTAKNGRPMKIANGGKLIEGLI